MRLYICVLVLGLCLPTLLIAQSTEAELRVRLVGKPLYLRGFWTSDKLHFNAAGQLQGHSDVGPFTLSSVDVKTVRLEKDSLIIDARCVGLAFKGGKPIRVALQVESFAGTHDETMHVQIDAPQDGNYIPALDAIFMNNLAALVPSLPDFWQKYAQANFLSPGTSDGEAAPASASKSIDKTKGLVAPQVLRAVDPIYPEAARLLKYGGTVTVSLYVEPDGTGSHFSILKPAGLGLDEQAVFAVQQYSFKPATRDGIPTRVELRIAVNFQAGIM